MNIETLSIVQLQEHLKSKKVSVPEIIKAVFDRIEKVEPRVHSYLSLDKAQAVQQAQNLQKQLDVDGYPEYPSLFGIPLALKDNMCTKDFPTTCASKMLEHFQSPYDATVVEKIKAHKGIILGKTNMDEFAMGSSTENSGIKKTANPWNTEKVPGGSSGGAASAVAACEAYGALGSDTGGSIRQPASFCGVVGMKPTYGTVSRYGLIAFASSFDQIGPLARTVEDCSLILQCIAGHDERDNTSFCGEVPDYMSNLKQPVKGKVIGIPREYFAEGLSDTVKNVVDKTIQKLEELGVECREISLPHTEYAIATYYIIATAEASSNLARFDGVHYGYRTPQPQNTLDLFSKSRSEGFGDEVKRRIMLGTYVLSAGYYDAYYLKALKVRTLIKNDFEKAFKKCDAVLTPTCPTPAYSFGEKMHDPLEMYLGDVFTIPSNLAGLPGISINGGYDDNKLPVGVQLIGQAFKESALLNIAWNLEQALDLKEYPEL